MDPELGLDLVAMGLVYDIREEGGRVVVDMTLTTPGCPVSETLPTQAWEAAGDVLGPAGFAEVDVNLVWDPLWTPERLTAEAADTLGNTMHETAPEQEHTPGRRRRRRHRSLTATVCGSPRVWGGIGPASDLSGSTTGALGTG